MAYQKIRELEFEVMKRDSYGSELFSFLRKYLLRHKVYDKILINISGKIIMGMGDVK